jgi:DegV family protein with EDD domain
MGPTRIALVTDSTWSLPPALAESLGVRVLPLHVLAGTTSIPDVPAEAERITGIIRATAASTSQPTPGAIRDLLGVLADEGSAGIVCIHLSAQLSGTCGSVRAVAGEVSAERGIPVEVIDSRTVAGALGYAVAVAGANLAAGASMADAMTAARECAATSRVFLSVADLRHLQRGGRLRVPQLAIGTALGIKPILEVRHGEIRLRESVRGSARARQRLVDLALRSAGAPKDGVSRPRVSFAVHHADCPDAAATVAEMLAAAAAEADIGVDRLDVTPMAGVLAVHAGPGALAVATARTCGLVHS